MTNEQPSKPLCTACNLEAASPQVLLYTPKCWVICLAAQGRTFMPYIYGVNVGYICFGFTSIYKQREKILCFFMVFMSVDDIVFSSSVCHLILPFLFVKFYDLTCYYVTLYFQATTKEGYLLKQTWSFQRWRRRYFRLKGHRLYYAKDAKVRSI